MARAACSDVILTCLCNSNIQVKDPAALIMGRSRNEQTPDGAAQTVGIEFTTRAAVATQPAVVGSSSSKTTSAVNDGVPSTITRKPPGPMDGQCGATSGWILV